MNKKKLIVELAHLRVDPVPTFFLWSPLRDGSPRIVPPAQRCHTLAASGCLVSSSRPSCVPPDLIRRLEVLQKVRVPRPLSCLRDDVPECAFIAGHGAGRRSSDRHARG